MEGYSKYDVMFLSKRGFSERFSVNPQNQGGAKIASNRCLSTQTAGESLRGFWRRKGNIRSLNMSQCGRDDGELVTHAVKKGTNKGIGHTPPVPVQNRL
jgi:hypothetical protein